MKAAIYTRVSSPGQKDGESLPDQEAKCRALCAERGYEVTGFYKEVHTGVALFTRPKLMELHDAIIRGEYDRVVVSHPDRWTRDPNDRGYLIRLAERYGVRWEFVTQDRDDTTLEGAVMGTL